MLASLHFSSKMIDHFPFSQNNSTCRGLQHQSFIMICVKELQHKKAVPGWYKHSISRHRCRVRHWGHSGRTSPPGSGRNHPVARGHPAPWRGSWRSCGWLSVVSAATSDSCCWLVRGSRGRSLSCPGCAAARGTADKTMERVSMDILTWRITKLSIFNSNRKYLMQQQTKSKPYTNAVTINTVCVLKRSRWNKPDDTPCFPGYQEWWIKLPSKGQCSWYFPIITL